MMELPTIEHVFRESVASEVSLVAESAGRFRVFAPFGFDDGDEFVIVLIREGDRWVLSDEAHTYMHLSYDIDLADLRSGRREEIIANALTTFEIEDRNGELVRPIRGDAFGDALFSFVHGLLRIADVSYLSRSSVISTFITDFRTMLQDVAPEERLSFNWHDSNHDPEGRYSVDCRINGFGRPLVVQALPNVRKILDATITLHQFVNWGIDCEPIGVFDDKATISQPVLDRYSDVCNQQFSNLAQDRERVISFIKERIGTS